MFEQAPIALWEADAVDLQAWLDGLRADGVEELRRMLESDPQQVWDHLPLMKVRRANQAAVALFEADDQRQLLENIPRILADVPLAVFVELFVARWENRPSFRTETRMLTLRGRRLHELVTIALPGSPGRWDLTCGIVAFSDLTERHAAESALRESEELRRLAEEAGNVGSFDLDFRTGRAWVSDTLLAIYGLEPGAAEATRDAWLQRVHPDDWKVIEACVARFDPACPQWRCEFRIVRPCGAIRWIESRARTEFDAEGQPLRIKGVNVDVTDRKQAEESLTEKEERLRLILDASAAGWWHWDLASGRVTANAQAKALFGLAPDAEVSFETFLERLDPSEPERVMRELPDAIGSAGDFDSEFHLVWPDGSHHWILARGRPFRDASGETRQLMGLVMDITARKQTEDALRESEAFYRALFDTLPVGVVLANPRGNVTYASPKAREMFGLAEGEGLGTTPLDWIAPEHHAVVRERMQRVMREGVAQPPIEYRMLRRDGTSLWAELASAPFFDARGHLKGEITICQDITHRKRIEEELRQAKAAAESASQSKGAFLANMSHELRTPMTAIIGLTELNLDRELPSALREDLETVKNSADTLLALLNEILDFSRIEAGKLTLESCRFPLRATVQDTLKILSVRAEGKALSLGSDISADVPDDLEGDPLRLRQILTNLVGNGIKFTERGGVTVRVRREAATGAEETLRFEVADTGPGIAPEQQQPIFAPFAQGDASTARRHGGTGLGLAITSSLVQMMGGQIGVHSTPGRGSTFHFTVALRRPAQEPSGGDRQRPASAEPQAPSRPLHILLAEDTPANQKLIARILARRGHRVDTAANGKEALDLLHRHDFDVVLMDVQMPVVDGFQATQTIRRWDDPKARVPIVAMTAHAMKGDQQRCLAAGMDGYISKPINSRELTDLVERVAAAPAR